jgi:hypothetical protein
MAPPLVVSLLLTAGSMAASYLMMPRIRQQPTDTGKMDDVRVTGSEYGTFIPRIFGRARLGSNAVWSTGIDHKIIDIPSSGGKGIPQAPAQRQHLYFTDVGLQVCRGPVVEFERLWADADLIADRSQRFRTTFEAEDGVLAGTAVIVDPDPSARGGKSVTGIGDQGSGTPGTVTFDLRGVIPPDLPPSEDPDELKDPISRYEFYVKSPGGRALVVDFIYDTAPTLPVTNTISILPSDTDGTWQIYTVEVAGFADEIVLKNPDGPAPDLDTVRLHQRWYTSSTENAYVVGTSSGFKDPDFVADDAGLNTAGAFDYIPAIESDGVIIGNLTVGGTMRFYTGTSNQRRDDKHIQYMATRYGTVNASNYTPAYRDTVMMVFDGMNLKQGRVPNFTVELYNNFDDCNDVLNALCEDVGIASGQRDFADTSGFSFVGYIESNKQSRRGHVENLERYFGFRVAEVDGKLTTVVDDGQASYNPSTDTPRLIDPDLLRAHLEGSEMPSSDFVVTISDPVQASKEVRFSVMNPRAEYHNETVSAMIEEGVSSVDAVEYTFPIVDDLEQARRRAEFMLLKLHAEQQRITFEAMPEMMRYTVGDLVTLDIEGEKRVVRIEKKQAQMPMGVVRIEGVITDNVYVTALDTSVTELSPIASDQLATIAYPRTGKVTPIISRPIFDKDNGRLGVYVGVSNAGFGISQGTALYREYGEDNYLLDEFFDSPCTMGVTDGTLGTHTDATTEDTTNTIDILFYDETSLESVSGTDLDRRPTLNLIRIGDEWVQFRTATLDTVDKTSPFRSKWTLSNLRRGRFATESAMAGHGADEDALVVTPSVRFIKLEDADIGETVTFKAVAGGQDIDEATPVSFTFNPLSAYNVTNATDDRTFDADCTTMDELADVVATIIKDTRI